MNILKNATENIANPGPEMNFPIIENNPFTNALPFSGSKALSKPSANDVPRLNILFKAGPIVRLPSLSPKLVTVTVKTFNLAKRSSCKNAFFSIAALPSEKAVLVAFPKTEVSELKSFNVELTTLIWKTPPASSFISLAIVGSATFSKA